MDLEELILNPARVPGFPNNVYCIGPFGYKVGFGFQQKRALNLVYALKKKSLVGSRTNVAVVGGGLAGLMACCALKGLGCNVTLYESYETPLERQLDARHRVVHPSINAWPMIDYPRSTTNFPFYDWYVASCSDVVRSLWEDWDEHQSNYVSEFRKFSKVLKVKETDEAPDILKVVFENIDPATRTGRDEDDIRDGDHEIVIIATGFGDEELFDANQGESYWDPDILDRVRRRREKYKSIIVSGTGDGGLIDCCRLVHSQFDDGKIALKVMGSLRHTQNRPGKQKASFSLHEEDIQNVERNAHALRTAGKSPDEISIEMRDGYLKVIESLPGEVRDFLDDSLFCAERVTLYGRTATPFTFESAPINKVLMAHVLWRHPDLYVQADIHEREDGLYAVTGSGEARLTPDFYVCRHGASPPIKTIVPGFDVDAFTGRQKDIADVLDFNVYDHCFFLEHAEFAREGDPGRRKYFEDRLEAARSYAAEFFGQLPRPFEGDEENGVVFRLFDTETYRESKRKTGGLDHDLFGVPIVLEDEPVEMSPLTRTERSRA